MPVKKKGIRTTTVHRVPQWASYYIEYGESDNLTEKEVKMVDRWLEDLRKEGLRLICPIEGTENEFDSNPAFGLACGVQDWTAEIVGREGL